MIGGLPTGSAIAILVWPVCVAAIVAVALLTSGGGADIAAAPEPEPTPASVEPTDD